MVKFAAMLLGVALLSTQLAAQQRFICEIDSKFSCSAGSGCSDSKLGIWNVVDFGAGTFQRCDRNGCDSYPMAPIQSGLFINFMIPERAMFAKMSGDGSQYVEVVSIATDVLVSFGSCRAQ